MVKVIFCFLIIRAIERRSLIESKSSKARKPLGKGFYTGKPNENTGYILMLFFLKYFDINGREF